jgi:ribosome-associated toxin RatA of RatAB toxin-antitoxin module
MGLLTYTKRSSAVVAADPELVYEILTDYDGYSEWMPLIARSVLLAKEGDLAIAEFELVRPSKEKFAVECIHTKNRMVLTRTISGRIPVRQIEWDLSPSGQGTDVKVVVEARTNWHRILPAYRRFINPVAFLAGLRAQLSSFSPEALPDEEGEKIFELTESEQGLVCWIRGKKYTLTPAPEGKND